jgi:hypothetical protein
MAAFSFSQHQDVLTYLTHLKATGWTIEDAQAWIKAEKENIESDNTKSKPKFCPECQAPMRILPVNVSPSTITGDDSQSVWMCSKKDCGNTIYNKESVNDIIKKGGN